MDEFSCDIEFKFGVPLIILDLIYALTGYEIVEDIRKHVDPPKNIERLNPDAIAYLNDKNGIVEEYHDLIFGIFNCMGELNL